MSLKLPRTRLISRLMFYEWAYGALEDADCECSGTDPSASEYKTAADQIAAVAEKATAELRDKLDSEYKSAAEDAWPDEDIFMAIAEDIGFDATGKSTKVNELDEIGVALAKFIMDEKGEGL